MGAVSLRLRYLSEVQAGCDRLQPLYDGPYQVPVFCGEVSIKKNNKKEISTKLSFILDGWIDDVEDFAIIPCSMQNKEKSVTSSIYKLIYYNPT